MREIDEVFEEAYDLVNTGKPLSTDITKELLAHNIDIESLYLMAAPFEEDDENE
ncbi:hypothetical protein HOR87_gp31 [Marinomonas phage CB5A]|uniref:Uncharacterized protein n=1 Tax=Marinomonas phage CB5A TaxID=2022859 RepID=A0A222G3E5_9CAUD|nr:hypothetical protein HOR87_gp31 [Marinomonas phage CB5A]ASP46252.1 hypothetical protein [Marinomonas phage CB5A]